MKWTIEKCWEESLKCKTRKDFELQNKCAYGAAQKHKWLNDICSHMKRFGNKLYRCIYVYEFSDNCVYVGLTYNIEKRNESRKRQINDTVTKHIKNTNIQPILKQLSEYVYVDIAATLENDLIEFYKNNGWNVLNKAIGGAIGCSERRWTKELCHKEALKYKTRQEFYDNSNKVHSAACRYGWLNDICSHMIIVNKHWTIDEVKLEALKYKTRGEFGIKNKAAYNWAIRHGILNEACSHMQSAIGNNQYGKH